MVLNFVAGSRWKTVDNHERVAECFTWGLVDNSPPSPSDSKGLRLLYIFPPIWSGLDTPKKKRQPYPRPHLVTLSFLAKVPIKNCQLSIPLGSVLLAFCPGREKERLASQGPEFQGM